MTEFISNLKQALHTSFIDQNEYKSNLHKPALLINNQQDQNVLNELLDELDCCESFLFSVAFITESGLATLKSHLLDLKHRGVRGRIVTSTYLSFNKPQVFRELLKIDNVDVRLTDLDGFHAKGYIFKHATHYSFIVGSSNLTSHALKVNYEWNIKLTSHQNGELIDHFNHQFEKIWDQAIPLTESWINTYQEEYKSPFPQKTVEKVIDLPGMYQVNTVEKNISIKPNKMQTAALSELRKLRQEGNDKGLIISATGTGKTYLAAFDVRRYRPKRMLFIVHREQILKKALDDFYQVIGGKREDYGILSGSKRAVDAKYVFATIQTISRQQTLSTFESEDFDYILIDEVHKSGANSYLRVIDYFKPNFLLGMTATPERTDNFNIFALFDYNIAYEIRLQEALEEDMLAAFHYFGVTDFVQNGELIDDLAQLDKLVTDERLNHIIEKINYYGFSGDYVRGLMFCSRKEEAQALSVGLNNRGLRTIALTGVHSQEERIAAVEALENGELEYIITVDIFNEGIDIPSLNQIVMLRQTESSIIFIQQLGRGLRKHESKDFVTIIDFIGNYKNNYLIPIALSGDRSQNKDNVRKYLKDTSFIKGVSTINFEEVARKQIFASIDKTNLAQLKIIREAYQALKNRIGKIPTLYSFIEHRSIDPEVIVKLNGINNYPNFLHKMKETIPPLTQGELQVVTMFSLELLNGKRMHEVLLIELLMKHQGKVDFSLYEQTLINEGLLYNQDTLRSVQRLLDLSFFTKPDQKKYGETAIVLFEKDVIYFHASLINSIQADSYFMHCIQDIINVAKVKNQRYTNSRALTLYEKYSKKDICRLLNWDTDEKGTIFGYRTKYNTSPIFITYHKNDEVEESIDYGDELLNPTVLRWYTRNNRTLQSREVKKIIEAKSNGNDIHLFVKKDDDEGNEFYYLGEALPEESTIEETVMESKGKDLPVVRMNMLLEKPIEPTLYKYIKEA